MFNIALWYLAAPVFIVLFSFFSLPFVLISLIALIILIFCCTGQQHDTHKISSLTRYWPFMLVAIVVSCSCLVFPFQPWDWEKHYAVFDLLVSEAWPPVLELDDKIWVLRYYIAWHVLPVLIGKIFGMQFLLVAMLIWVAMGLFIALTLAFHDLHKVRYLFLAALIFFFFSGLDLIGAWLTNNFEVANTAWLQGWVGDRVFTIFANLTSLQFATQHAIAAFLAVSIFMYNRFLAVQYGAVIIVVMTFWSPFCAVGLLPIALWALLQTGYRTAFTIQNLVAAPLLAMPIFLYLTQGAGDITRMFIWNDKNFIFSSAIMFYLFEFIAINAIFYQLCKEKRQLIAIITAFLCIICLFKLGIYNDLVARGSIPAVCVMAILMLQSLLQNRGWRRDLLLVFLLVGALPVVVAVSKSFGQILPQSERRITMSWYLDKYKPPDGSQSYRQQYLADMASTKLIFTVPLLRSVPKAQP